MSMAYIRATYKVPAKRGARVRYTFDRRPAREGVVVGSYGPLLRILMDGDTKPGLYHPSWEMKYL